MLQGNAAVIRERLGFPLELARVADKDTTSDRGVALAPGVLGGDARALIEDPALPIVVELIGGISPAKEFILEALRRGKCVVTANKALLAQHWEEIFRAAAAGGGALGFEASVCGGIPIIRALREGLAANRIQSMHGIINGTTNYILSRMTDEGLEYGSVLKKAQELGFAEADPTLDVEGHDAAHKLAILASLAFGTRVRLEQVHTEGIDAGHQDRHRLRARAGLRDQAAGDRQGRRRRDRGARAPDAGAGALPARDGGRRLQRGLRARRRGRADALLRARRGQPADGERGGRRRDGDGAAHPGRRGRAAAARRWR